MRDGESEIASSLADPTRRRILERLAEEPGLTTGELTGGFRQLTRWAVLKHLAALRRAALVETLPEGRRRRHYLNRSALEPLTRWLEMLALRGPSPNSYAPANSETRD